MLITIIFYLRNWHNILYKIFSNINLILLFFFPWINYIIYYQFNFLVFLKYNLFYINIVVCIYIYIYFYDKYIELFQDDKYKLFHQLCLYLFLNFFLFCFWIFNYILFLKFYQFIGKFLIYIYYIKTLYFDYLYQSNNFWYSLEIFYKNIQLSLVEISIYVQEKNVFTLNFIDWFKNKYFWKQSDIFYYITYIHVLYLVSNDIFSENTFKLYLFLFQIIPDIYYDIIFYKNCFNLEHITLFQWIYFRTSENIIIKWSVFIHYFKQIYNWFDLNNIFWKYNYLNIFLYFQFLFSNKLYLEYDCYIYIIQLVYIIALLTKLYLIFCWMNVTKINNYLKTTKIKKEILFTNLYNFLIFFIIINFCFINIYLCINKISLIFFFTIVSLCFLCLNFLIILYVFLLIISVNQIINKLEKIKL